MARTHTQMLLVDALHHNFTSDHWDGWARDLEEKRIPDRPGRVTAERARENAVSDARMAGKLLGLYMKARLDGRL